MYQTWSDLPDECWELILTKLDHRHSDLESLSLVSKRLLSVTSQCRPSLRVVNPSIQILTTSLKRYPFLNKIDFSDFRGELHEALVKISESNLDLNELNISHNTQIICSVLLKKIGKKMTNIKVFKSSHSNLSDTHMFILAEFFKSIEELDISRQHVQNITDQGIVALSMKHKSLRKINVSGNAMISDHSLISLSAVCLKLTEIAVTDCIHVSQIGISAIIGNCSDFSSLILGSDVESHLILTSPFIGFTKHLCKIELSYMKISNEILYDMVRANLPLKLFRLSYCRNFTQDGLSYFLKAYQYLESLALDGIDFITDDFLVLISEFIGYLTFISLESCYELTGLSFATIALVCPSLETVNMRITSSSNEARHDLLLNPSIKSCSIQCRTLDGLLQICPNLEILNVSFLAQPEELDIGNILSTCRDLRQLTINFNDKLKFNDGIPCKLEKLSLNKSGVDEQVLEMVSKRCPELLNLDLEGGVNVTEKGVKMVVQNCKKLRYVNLDTCTKLNKDIVEWMVASSPSLREIVIPYPFKHNHIDVGNCLLKLGSSLPFAFYIWNTFH
ncbi:uncharacterized protein LOC141649718 [Silene latifolia]|uniref:uncharacterized protein LOC141649718 n=1 Tax=Silene latifolia TaxID=37657 RepID=UPI003D7886AB